MLIEGFENVKDENLNYIKFINFFSDVYMRFHVIKTPL